MYQVFQEHTPCDTEGFPKIKKGNGWDNSKFETFDEAVEYAHKWAFPITFDLMKGYFTVMKLNTPAYIGGVMMEIRKVQ